MVFRRKARDMPEEGEEEEHVLRVLWMLRLEARHMEEDVFP